MNTKLFAIILAGFPLLALGCDTMGPKAGTGAVAGGTMGAVAGGIIGHQSHSGAQGALIGAGLGALAGGTVGSTMDKRDRQAQAANPAYLPVTQIAYMASQGTPDSIIISEINRTRSVYYLNSEIIGYLKQNRVSDQVIDYMLSTANVRR